MISISNDYKHFPDGLEEEVGFDSPRGHKLQSEDKQEKVQGIDNSH
jgi:hypothetical protein